MLRDHGPFLWGLLFAFGFILFSSGLTYAFEESSIIYPNGTTTVIYPRLYIGIPISTIGLFVTIVGLFGIRYGLSRIKEGMHRFTSKPARKKQRIEINPS